jgi:PAS domain S-box-containing protein
VSYEEALAFDWRALVHPDDLGRLVAAAETQPTELVSMEARYRTPAGTWRWLHSESQPRWDESGAHVGYIGVAYDVTCAKQAALDLEALNATLEARVEARTRERDRAWKHSQDLQVVLNPHGIILAANEAWRAILGWAPEEVVGRHHLDFVQQSFHGAAAGALAAAMLAELPALEVLHRHKNGGTRWISWVAAPADGLVYASGRNITAEKEAAAALEAAQEQLRQSQKMEAVGQLTGGIAHDFNNLLTGITGSLEVLQTRLAQGRVAEAGGFIAAAQGAARRAGALTHRLLAFSRRQTLDPRVTDVNHLVAGMEELIRRTVGPSIVTEFIGAAGLWTTLVDRNQLENALLNLCINARDAMQDGGRLTIETMNTVLDARGARDHDLQPGQYVSLCVSDTGTGMAPEVIARAFDPFFTTKPIGQGTGLGLSMIYGFARQSGGQVRIHSLLGHGTTMCLYLPRHAGPGADVEERETRIPASRAGHGETVLVIDDEATVRTLVVEVLEELGYATLQAPDGRTAMALLESDCAIDLLVTDLGLPGGMSGRQVADQARLVRPGLKVLIITGYPKGEAPGDDPLPEGVAVLMKPFTLDALAVRIKSLIGAQGLAPGG